jgi:hypothetical protein
MPIQSVLEVDMASAKDISETYGFPGLDRCLESKVLERSLRCTQILRPSIRQSASSLKNVLFVLSRLCRSETSICSPPDCCSDSVLVNTERQIGRDIFGWHLPLLRKIAGQGSEVTRWCVGRQPSQPAVLAFSELQLSCFCEQVPVT